MWDSAGDCGRPWLQYWMGVGRWRTIPHLPASRSPALRS